MKLKHLTVIFLHGVWICAGLALGATSLASCTYTLPSVDGSGGGDGSCSTGLTNCTGKCVDTTSDVAHCGACGMACATGFDCVNGQCQAANPACAPGMMASCYDGPPETAAVGTCRPGIRTCLQDRSGFGPCMGQVLPSRDYCGELLDDDCNGSPATKGAICLTTERLVVRYVLNEAARRTEPATVLDSADEPLNLTVDYGAVGNMSYAEVGTGRGLQWFVAESSGTALAPIDGTKVYTALEGKTQGTIEVVTTVQATSGSSSRIFTIGAGPESGRFTLSANSTDRVQFRWNDNVVAGDWPLSFSTLGRCVLHVVVDTTQATADNRVRLFLNGMLVVGNTGTVPMQFEPIVVGPGRSLYLGNRDEGIRSFAGSLYYAALYDRPLAPSEIVKHAAYLVANDD